MKPTLRIGARGSLLSMKQTETVAQAIRALHPSLAIEIIAIKTTGDVILDRPLAEIGGKGLFTREIQRALLEGRVDLAVHSFKDYPITQPLVDTGGLAAAATLAREDPRDVIVSSKGYRLGNLPENAIVGTSSLRRKAQLLAVRPDLKIQPLRGNIDTRVKKAISGEFDAVLLAYAGMIRSGLFDPSAMVPIETDEIVPAPAQGALCLECRREDARTMELIGPLNHRPTMICVEVERKMVELLNGDCHSPIGALALICNNELTLKTRVGMPQGFPPIFEAQTTVPLEAGMRACENSLQILIKKGLKIPERPKPFLDDNIQNSD